MRFMMPKISPQGGAPQVISWFIIPMKTIIINTINHSEMGVICTKLANELGHHLAHIPHLMPVW